MKKTIKASGSKGTFEGNVEVVWEVGTIKGRDGQGKEKDFKTHKIIGTHNGVEMFSSEEFAGKASMVKHATLVEKALQNYLNNLAEGKTAAGGNAEPTMKDMLSEMGFQ